MAEFHDQVYSERPKQMSKSTWTIRGALIWGVVALGLLLSGCSPTTEPQNTPSPSAANSPSAPPSSPAESPTWVPPSSPPLNPDYALTINIVIAKGKTIPNGVKYDLRVGQKVILKVTSDTDDEIHAHTGGGGYVNFMMGDGDRARLAATYGDNYERLVALKTKYDPTNFFHENQNIPPAEEGPE